MYRLLVLLFSLSLALARHHYLSPEKSEFAELEAYNERAQRIIAAKDETIKKLMGRGCRLKKLMGRVQAIEAGLDPIGNDPSYTTLARKQYGEWSDGAHGIPMGPWGIGGC